MQKTVFKISVLLLFLLLLLPFGMLLAYCLGYQIALADRVAFAAAPAILALAATVLSLTGKIRVSRGFPSALLALSPMFAMVNAWFYLLQQFSLWGAGCMILCAGLCCFLAIRHGKSPTLKGISLVLTGICLILIFHLGFFIYLFGNIGHNTVVQTVPSPNKTRYAEVIDNDQGALGGSTIVCVKEYWNLDLFILEITKKPYNIYIGEWGEFEDIKLHWDTEEILVINGKRYGLP